jgi:hypothetical protein
MDAPTKYAVTITLSGQQGDVMRMHRQLPPVMLERFRLLFQEVDACHTVHTMTQAKHTRADIAKATGRSIKWVTARQNEMGLLHGAHRGRKKIIQ